jgi:hypothetical protein
MFSHRRLQSAVKSAAAEAGGFISPSEVAKCHCANRMLRRLDEKSPRMIQFFRSGAVHYISALPLSPDSAVKDSTLAKFFTDAMLFIGSYCRELGFDQQLFTLKFELSPLNVLQLDSGKEKYSSRTSEAKRSFIRRADDYAAAPAAYAAMMMRCAAEAFTLPENSIKKLDALIFDKTLAADTQPDANKKKKTK